MTDSKQLPTPSINQDVEQARKLYDDFLRMEREHSASLPAPKRGIRKWLHVPVAKLRTRLSKEPVADAHDLHRDRVDEVLGRILDLDPDIIQHLVSDSIQPSWKLPFLIRRRAKQQGHSREIQSALKAYPGRCPERCDFLIMQASFECSNDQLDEAIQTIAEAEKASFPQEGDSRAAELAGWRARIFSKQCRAQLAEPVPQLALESFDQATREYEHWAKSNNLFGDRELKDECLLAFAEFALKYPKASSVQEGASDSIERIHRVLRFLDGWRPVWSAEGTWEPRPELYEAMGRLRGVSDIKATTNDLLHALASNRKYSAQRGLLNLIVDLLGAAQRLAEERKNPDIAYKVRDAVERLLANKEAVKAAQQSDNFKDVPFSLQDYHEKLASVKRGATRVIEQGLIGGTE